MTVRLRVLGALAAPLLLAGCGMPVGVQVASLFADGISLFTTDKTLTDHGLSAATGEDCALWRGLRGDEVCRGDPDAPTRLATGAVAVSDAGPLMNDSDVADYAGPVIAPEPTALAGNAPEPWFEPVDPRGRAPAAELAKAARIKDIGPEWAPREDAPPPGAAAPAAAVVETRLDPSPAELAKAGHERVAEPAPTAELANAGNEETAETKSAPTVTRVPAEAAPRGGVFFVIGSYRSLAYAERFAGRQKGLDLLILSGALKGRPIYRVAVGPVPEARRARVHDRLVAAGHNDAWALELKAPRVAAELASLN